MLTRICRTISFHSIPQQNLNWWPHCGHSQSIAVITVETSFTFGPLNLLLFGAKVGFSCCPNLKETSHSGKSFGKSMLWWYFIQSVMLWWYFTQSALMIFYTIISFDNILHNQPCFDDILHNQLWWWGGRRNDKNQSIVTELSWEELDTRI